MKKKIVAALLIGALSISLPCTCLAESETAASETEETAEEEDSDELKTIGEEAEGCMAFTVKNSSKKGIAGISIKAEQDTDYPEELKMEENEIFGKSERGMLYYVPPVSEESGEENSEPKKYDIRLTFEDQSTAIMHQVALEDIKDGKLVIRVKDGVYYLAYTSVETEEKTDTYEAEKAIADEEAAQAQAAAEAQAAAQAQAAAEAQAAAAAQPAEGGDACLEGGLLN